MADKIKRHYILEVTADTLELVVNIFDGVKDCAVKKGLTTGCVATRIQKGIKDPKTETKLISVWLNPEEVLDGIIGNN